MTMSKDLNTDNLEEILTTYRTYLDDYREKGVVTKEDLECMQAELTSALKDIFKVKPMMFSLLSEIIALLYIEKNFKGDKNDNRFTR
jgi:hypothetical protein